MTRSSIWNWSQLSLPARGAVGFSCRCVRADSQALLARRQESGPRSSTGEAGCWVRVSPGCARSCCRSSGLSTSTAMPGRCNTMQGLPVAWAAARCGLKAVVAEAQRKQICGAAEGGVGAASVGGGNQHRSFRGSLRENLIEFAGLNQRNIRGDDQCAVDAARQRRVAWPFRWRRSRRDSRGRG